jgi:hypothetical protein
LLARGPFAILSRGNGAELSIGTCVGVCRWYVFVGGWVNGGNIKRTHTSARTALFSPGKINYLHTPLKKHPQRNSAPRESSTKAPNLKRWPPAPLPEGCP